MTKAEIKKAKDNELIVDYVRTYSSFCLNVNLGMGIKQYSKHCTDLEEELVKRGILTEENVRILRL